MDIHTHLLQTLASIESNFDLLSCKTLISWDDLESHYSEDFSDLEHIYYDQVKSMNLDELIVGALAPFFEAILESWDVLESPSLGSSVLKKWIRLLDISDSLLQHNKKQKVMTFYESLLDNTWMPKIRNAIQNRWDPRIPEPLILLLESWNDLIPRWLEHNIYEQLVAPKLKSEIENWNYRKESSPLYSWLFPWLPIAAEKFSQLGVWEQARLKIGSCLLDWKPSEDWALKMVQPWKEV
jgi:tuftelin-interacting protein 11